MKKTKKKDLKVIKGEFRKDRKNNNIPKMPSGLSPESKKCWKRIMREIDKSILLPGDSFALMLLCDALAGYYETEELLKEKGKTYELTDSKGRAKRYKRPEVEILSMYSELVLSGLKQFFLTPGSRRDLHKLTE